MDSEKIIRILKETEYRPIPERLENSEIVISFAQEFADRYRLHMDIVREKTCIIFRIGGRDMLYTRFMKKELAGLMLMCDELNIVTKGVSDWDYLLELIYYTHDMYVDGRKVSLAK